MKRAFPWGLLVAPFFALAIAIGVVHNQSARHDSIEKQLRDAKQEISRLEKMLPKGETAPIADVDDCKDENHKH
jgi:hypothetical protein